MVTIFFSLERCYVWAVHRSVHRLHSFCLSRSFTHSFPNFSFSLQNGKKMITTRKKRTAIQTKSKSHNCMSEHEFYLHRFFLHVGPTNEWKKERVEYLFILISLLQRLCSCDDISFMLCEENVGWFFSPSFSRETIEQYSKCIHLWTTK